MHLNEYQVWHTYGTYFVTPFTGGLEGVAARLVANRLAVAAITSSGQVFALDGESVTQAALTMNASPDNMEARFLCPLLDLGGYTAEAIYQSSWMAFAEMRVTSSLLQEHAPYVRAFMNPVYLSNDEVGVLLYPQVKLYENGIVLLQLRLFSPAQGSSVGSLVKDYVNLAWMTIERIDVPPFLLSHFDAALIRTSYPRWWQKRRAKRLATEQSAAHISRGEMRNQGDFDFPMVNVPVDAYEMYDVAKFDFVRELFVAPLAFLLAERSNAFREMGNFWGPVRRYSSPTLRVNPIRSPKFTQRSSAPLRRY